MNDKLDPSLRILHLAQAVEALVRGYSTDTKVDSPPLLRTLDALLRAIHAQIKEL
jgi:hypothetical protein